MNIHRYVYPTPIPEGHCSQSRLLFLGKGDWLWPLCLLQWRGKWVSLWPKKQNVLFLSTINLSKAKKCWGRSQKIFNHSTCLQCVEQAGMCILSKWPRLPLRDPRDSVSHNQLFFQLPGLIHSSQHSDWTLPFSNNSPNTWRALDRLWEASIRIIWFPGLSWEECKAKSI